MCGLAFYEAFNSGGIADMETKTSVVKPTSTGADRVKRGFNRIALVGAVAAVALFFVAVGLCIFLFVTSTSEDRAISSVGWELCLIPLGIGGAWVAFWLVLSWVIRGFMSEGNSNHPQGDNSH